jgi:predicted DNA-binding transcriptional regulator AlpA
MSKRFEPEDIAGAEAPTGEAEVEIEVLYEDEIGLNEVTAILGLSKMRAATLVRQNKIPSAIKNSRGAWRFSRSIVEQFAVERPKGTRAPSTNQKGNGKLFKVRLTLPQIQLFEATFGDTATLEPGYNYEYQKRRKAQLAAAKKAK